jgi:hypothetical protein
MTMGGSIFDGVIRVSVSTTRPMHTNQHGNTSTSFLYMSSVNLYLGNRPVNTQQQSTTEVNWDAKLLSPGFYHNLQLEEEVRSSILSQCIYPRTKTATVKTTGRQSYRQEIVFGTLAIYVCLQKMVHS